VDVMKNKKAMAVGELLKIILWVVFIILGIIAIGFIASKLTGTS